MCMTTIWELLGVTLGGSEQHLGDLYCFSCSPPAFLRSILPLIPHVGAGKLCIGIG